MTNRLIQKYSYFVTRHPFIVLILVVLLSAFAVEMADTIKTKRSDIKDMMPQNVEAVHTINIIENEFGSTNTLFFAVEVVPEYKSSDEIRDVRDPRVIRYMNQLSELALHTEDVLEVTSPASVLKIINDGRLPQSLREIQTLSNSNGLLEGYISRDYTIALARIRTTDNADFGSIEHELEKILMQVPKPSGIRASLGDRVMEDLVMEKSIEPDMAKTSTYSMIGILAIVLLLCRSIKYSLISMTALILGSLWAMGYVGLIKMEMTPETSGVLSMIMGIGIDFGIQVVTRYRLELHDKSPQEAMSVSLDNVIFPMSTTTLAALIGFQAMSLGELTFLADMGNMMTYGVVASMLAAITAIPALVIILSKYNI